MLENIIFGVLVVLVAGAGIFTYLYEADKLPKELTTHQNSDEQK